MKRESYQSVIEEISLNVTAGKIDSIRRKHITKTGCRVYDNGCLGVAGTFGEATEETWQAAEAALQDQVPYPYTPTSGSSKVRDLREGDLTDQAFLTEMEDCLATLRAEHPDIIFSNKMQMLSSREELRNDTGLSYVNLDRTVSVELLIKHVNSLNVYDGYLLRTGRQFDKAAFLEEARQILDSFRHPVALPATDAEGKLPVILMPEFLLGKFETDLSGELIGGGSSLFAGKIGETLFSPDFTLVQDVSRRRHHVAFFDMEGFDREANPVTFIEKGVLKQGFTHKKSAERYQMPLTGNADCAYDGVPVLGTPPLTILPDTRSLAEMLDGKLGVLVIVTGGGDYTNEGNYGAPVQLAMLTDGKRLLGRLPECNIGGNLFELFGKDYIGVSSDRPCFGEHVLLTNMRVTE